MRLENIVTLGYSPTGTTATILAAIAKGFGGRFCGHIDMTLPAARRLNLPPFPECLVVIGVPVYGGRVPLDAVDYLKTLHGNGQATVLVAVYGNRDYDDALLELGDIAKDRGFVPIAAAAFIGEHSFSTEERPIAAGRPDKEDLKSAEKFGTDISNLIEQAESLETLAVPVIPGHNPYKERKPLPDGSPETDMDICNLCGLCARLCPVGAINPKNPILTDGQACTFCCACVKACPTGARVLRFEPMAAARDKMSETCRERREPEVFLPR